MSAKAGGGASGACLIFRGAAYLRPTPTSEQSAAVRDRCRFTLT